MAGENATAAARGHVPTATVVNSTYAGGADSTCTTPGPPQPRGATAYTRPRWSTARATTLSPPGVSPAPGPGANVRVSVLISMMPFAPPAMSRRPDGGYTAGPGRSPRPMMTATSVRAAVSPV